MNIKNLHRCFWLLLMGLIHGCGVEFSDKAMLSVKTVGDPYPACKSELCDKAWQADLFSLVEPITNNKNIVPVALLKSDEKVIDVNAERAIELRGFKIVDASVPCREVDTKMRISGPVIPSLKDFAAVDDGHWKICAAAVVPPEGRNLYNSPSIIVDKTAPEKHGVVFVSSNGTLTPTLSWAAAIDHVTPRESMRYRVTVARDQGNGMALLGSDPIVLTQTNNDLLTITGLEGGNTYSAVVTAIDEAGNETNYDAVQVQAGPPTVPILSISDASKSHAKDEETVTWTVSFTHADTVTLAASNVTFTKANVADSHVLETAVSCTDATSCEVTATIKSGDGGISGITIAAGVSTNVLGLSAETSKVTSVTVDTTAPVAPVIADASKSFNTAFNSTISQGIPADTNFKEIRYNLSSTDPTCLTGIVYNSNISIPAATTEVRAITCDQAGNASSVASATYTYDTGAPGSPAVVSSSGYSSANSFTWTWSAGSGDGIGTYRYRLDNGDLSTGATITTAMTYTATGLSDGEHRLYVEERDSAGNWSTAGSSSVMIDTTVPLVPNISESSKVFNASFTVTLAQNATVDANFKEFRYNLSASALTCSSGTVYASSVSIPAATTTLTAISCDMAGNASSASTATYTYDNTPPSAPVATSAAAHTSNTSVTWTWSAGGGDGTGTFRYKLDNSDLSSGTTQTTATSYTQSGLSEGSHTLYVEERDAVGNWSSAGSFVVTVDTTAPVAPVIADATKSFNASFTTTLSQGIPADSNFKEFRYNLGTTVPSCSTGTVYSSSVTIPAATTTVTVVACDMAGNISSSSQAVYTFDNTPPTAPTVTSSAAYIANTSVTWTWSAGSGGSGTYRYRLDNSDLTSGATVTTNTSFTGSSLTESVHTLYVQERDDVGNWSSSGSYSVTVDLTPPGAPTVTSSQSLVNSNSVTWTWLSAGGGNGLYRYKLDSSDLTAGATATSSLTFTGNSLAEGSRILYVQERDAAGNWSASGSYAVTVDTIVPTITGISISPASPATVLPITVSFTLSESAALRMYSGSSCSSAVSSSVLKDVGAGTISTSAITTGSYNLYLQGSDAAGNVSACTLIQSGYNVSLVPPAPTGFVASSSQPDSVSLSWTSGGLTTSAFQVAYSAFGSPADCTSGHHIASSLIGNSTSYTVSGLIGSTVYYFRLCAVDSAGVFSDGVTTSTSTAEAPVITILSHPVDFTAGSDRTVSFSVSATSTPSATLSYVWQVSRDGGVNYSDIYIDSYLCTYWPNGWWWDASQPNYYCSSGTGPILSISDIATTANGDKFRVLVGAPGAGFLPSSPATLIVPQWPPAPDTFSAVTLSNARIGLSWRGKGGTTTGYQIAYQVGSSPPATCSAGTVVPPNVIGMNSSYAVSGLSGGTTYSFRICSHNNSANLLSSQSATATAITVASGVASTPTGLSIEALIVGGGGGGGNSWGGGGGAGGLIQASTSITTGTSYSVSIGMGGAPGQNPSWNGQNGGASAFGAYSAAGGGGGGRGYWENCTFCDGLTGASGGGGGRYNGLGGSGTSGQGYSGGSPADNYGGGGGGAGGAAPSGVTGVGGVGIISNITGENTYYAGGGGGASIYGGQAAGLGGGGIGGGWGAGAGAAAGQPGWPNTGGGGGGSVDNITGYGGSGVVVLRFASTLNLSVSAGLTYTNYESGGVKVYIFTSGTGTVTFASAVVAPTAPWDLAVTVGNGTMSNVINLSWTSDANITSYTIEWSLSSTGPYSTAWSGANGLAHNQPAGYSSMWSGGNTFYFRVIASNSLGSATSNAVSAYVPLPPGWVDATPAGSGSATCLGSPENCLIKQSSTNLTFTPPLARQSWANAINTCNNSVYAGYSDWRLPTQSELQNTYGGTTGLFLVWMTDFGVNLSSYHWSSTEYDASIANTVVLGNGINYGTGKGNLHNVRCVR